MWGATTRRVYEQRTGFEIDARLYKRCCRLFVAGCSWDDARERHPRADDPSRGIGKRPSAASIKSGYDASGGPYRRGGFVGTDSPTEDASVCDSLFPRGDSVGTGRIVRENRCGVWSATRDLVSPLATCMRHSPAIETAIQTIQAGGIVCFPTESTYGLAVDITNDEALAKLGALKGRDAQAPFALIVSDIAAATSLARMWPPRAARLAEQHWPGPLTIVVPAGALSPWLVGPSGGVGIRISSNPIALALAEGTGPITATSANPSGQPPATTTKTAQSYFGDAVDCYLDGGIARSPSSTIVSVSEDNVVRVLRKGAVLVGLDT